MKFGKSLLRVVETSDPEWGPFWINYKNLKTKIKQIETKQDATTRDSASPTNPSEIAKNADEVEFFTLIRNEIKKASDFYGKTVEIYRIRRDRIVDAYQMLKSRKKDIQDKNTWTRLLMACVKFYKDVLLMENYAIMNYVGFSKILKKHDKKTGYVTREAFMRNVMNVQNFTSYAFILDLIKEVESLFREIQQMDNVMPLHDEERVFIDAIRTMNQQATQMHAESSASTGTEAATRPGLPYDKANSLPPSSLASPNVLPHHSSSTARQGYGGSLEQATADALRAREELNVLRHHQQQQVSAAITNGTAAPAPTPTAAAGAGGAAGRANTNFVSPRQSQSLPLQAAPQLQAPPAHSAFAQAAQAALIAAANGSTVPQVVQEARKRRGGPGSEPEGTA